MLSKFGPLELLLLLNVAIFLWALIDLITRRNVKALPKGIWALLIILIVLIGPLSYLIFGRGEVNS